MQLVRHLNKGSAAGPAMYRGLYSIAFMAACRIAWFAAADPRLPNRYVLAQLKNNLDAPQPSLGYQIVKPDGTPAPGFEHPRINLMFNRLPAERDAAKTAYAEQSGITVYGSATTRFLYNVTNTVRDGGAANGVWDTNGLPSGDYILRIIAADYSGKEAHDNRDVLLTVR